MADPNKAPLPISTDLVDTRVAKALAAVAESEKAARAKTLLRLPS